MADDLTPADAAHVMRTGTRRQQPVRGRFARDSQGPTRPSGGAPDRVEITGYEIDADAVAAAIVDRLIAGRTLRSRAG
jgi:hypothetical protein